MTDPKQNGADKASGDDADLAQAFKDLTRGERTAAALEQQLDSLESKIEELLARASKDQQDLEDQANATKDSAGNGSDSEPQTRGQ